jgi:hypothetical protein
MKNKVIFFLTCVASLSCTVVLYCILFEEYSKLFFINVTVACLAELVLLMNVPVLSSALRLTFKNSAISGMLTLYAGLMFLWTTGVSLFMGPASSFRVLYIGMLVLTLVFVVAGGITRFAGEAIQQQGEADAAAVRRRNVSASEIVALFGEIKDIARKSPKVELENGISKLAVSVDMMTTIPVAKLERTPSMLNEAKERMLVVKSLLQLLNDGVHDDSSVVLEKIDELKRFVNVMKNSL